MNQATTILTCSVFEIAQQFSVFAGRIDSVTTDRKQGITGLRE